MLATSQPKNGSKIDQKYHIHVDISSHEFVQLIHNAYIFVLAYVDKICTKKCAKRSWFDEVMMLWNLKIHEISTKNAIISNQITRSINSELIKRLIRSKGYDLHKKSCKTEQIWWSYDALKFDNSRNLNEKSLLFQINSSDSSTQIIFSLLNF